MKISFIYDASCIGGLETASRNKMDYLLDLGVKCNIIFMQKAFEDEIFKGHEYHIAESFHKIECLTSESNIIDILSFNENVIKRFSKLSKPIIHESHCPDIYHYISNFRNYGIKAVIFPSKSQLQIVKHCIPRSIPSFYLYNCLGKSFIGGTSAPQSQQSKKIILWVGRIEKRKDPYFLTEVAKRLSDDFIIRVLTQTTGHDLEEFKKLIDLNGVRAKFQIITNCPYDKMLNQYREASKSGCYISTSHLESFGMTLIEAMYAECPMVLIDIPVFREIAGDAALYYTMGNAGMCAEQIKKTCSSKKIKDELISKGTKNYNLRFDPLKVCSSFIDVVRSLLYTSGSFAMFPHFL